MTNRYLEKVALNALKARTLAKEVGVIADPSSAWKYGLRRLRGSRGEALSGEALENARARLGALRSEDFNKLRQDQALRPSTEMSYYSKNGRVSNIGAGESRTVSLHPNDYKATDKGLTGYIGHTHHGVGVTGFDRNPHHVTLPSGYSEHDVRWSGGEYGRVFPKKLHDASHSTRLRKSLLEDMKSGELSSESASRIWGKYSPKTLSTGRQGRDIQHAILHPNAVVNDVYRISNRSIANTTQGVEALHRSVGVYNPKAEEAHLLKHRTVFLKHKD